MSRTKERLKFINKGPANEKSCKKCDYIFESEDYDGCFCEFVNESYEEYKTNIFLGGMFCGMFVGCLIVVVGIILKNNLCL